MNSNASSNEKSTNSDIHIIPQIRPFKSRFDPHHQSKRGPSKRYNYDLTPVKTLYNEAAHLKIEENNLLNF